MLTVADNALTTADTDYCPKMEVNKRLWIYLYLSIYRGIVYSAQYAKDGQKI